MLSYFTTPEKAAAAADVRGDPAVELQLLKERNQAKALDIVLTEVATDHAEALALQQQGENLAKFREHREAKTPGRQQIVAASLFDEDGGVDDENKPAVAKLFDEPTEIEATEVDLIALYGNMTNGELRKVTVGEIKLSIGGDLDNYDHAKLEQFLTICRDAGALVDDRKLGLTLQQLTLICSYIAGRELARKPKAASILRIGLSFPQRV